MMHGSQYRLRELTYVRPGTFFYVTPQIRETKVHLFRLCTVYAVHPGKNITKFYNAISSLGVPVLVFSVHKKCSEGHQ